MQIKPLNSEPLTLTTKAQSSNPDTPTLKTQSTQHETPKAELRALNPTASTQNCESSNRYPGT